MCNQRADAGPAGEVEETIAIVSGQRIGHDDDLSTKFGHDARSQEGGEKEGETDAANLRSLRFLL